MPFHVIDSYAEADLYAHILALTAGAGASNEINEIFLQCRFFQIGYKPEIDEIKEVVGTEFSSAGITVYFCTDGDVIFNWSDEKKEIIDDLRVCIWSAFSKHVKEYMKQDEFFAEYSFYDAMDSLKRECFRKQKKITKQSQKLSDSLANQHLITNFRRIIKIIATQKYFRSKPHILIVEDQVFSQKILMRILDGYQCHVASTCAEAILIYLEKYPDIVFLDIDLPDLSGHIFAKLLSKIDDDSYVVMVTSNNYQNDINKAVENKVKGFIAKPFKKQIILGVIEKYKKSKGKKSWI